MSKNVEKCRKMSKNVEICGDFKERAIDTFQVDKKTKLMRKIQILIRT